MSRSRQAVVNYAKSLIGLNEQDGSFKKIIDIYNTQTAFPRGTKMQYNWEWCAAFWSALAIALGYTDIMPIEIGCGELINAAKVMNIWQENDAHVPSPGDAVMYDWQDKTSKDNTGWPDHVGVVEYINEQSGYFVVIEGNNGGAVKRRTVSLNGKYIRGFITPNYDKEVVPVPVPPTIGKSVSEIAHEVIVGKWGSGAARKQSLAASGYDPQTIQNEVNRILNGNTQPVPAPTLVQKRITATCSASILNPSFAGPYVTTANLYCRNDAGTNKKALVQLPKGTPVRCYGYYSVSNGIKWLLIQAELSGVLYTGFSSIQFLAHR